MRIEENKWMTLYCRECWVCIVLIGDIEVVDARIGSDVVRRFCWRCRCKSRAQSSAHSSMTSSSSLSFASCSEFRQPVNYRRPLSSVRQLHCCNSTPECKQVRKMTKIESRKPSTIRQWSSRVNKKAQLTQRERATAVHVWRPTANKCKIRKNLYLSAQGHSRSLLSVSIETRVWLPISD